MGNHASQDRRDRSKGGELGQYTGSLKVEGQPFTLHPRSSSNTSPSSKHQHHHHHHHHNQQQQQQQQQNDDQAPSLHKGNKDKENEENTPPRPRPPVNFGNKKMLPVVIKWSGGGNNVAIAGTFNQWQKIPMVKSEKDFVAIVDLPEGSHHYKFLVDGEWKVSKEENNTNKANNNNNNNNNSKNNSSGNDNNNKSEGAVEANNNVITISETDFEEFETALMPDPNDRGGNKEGSQGSTGSKEKGDSGAEEEELFGQDIPEYQQSEKIRGPPVLPPHLLQVILNKDTPISCEPTLLPNPNHVMLNHMYALSIRDGMMVLSTSNRYKKKCVTTLIYRPI